MQVYEKIECDKNLPIKLINISVDECGKVDVHWHRSIEVIVPKRGSAFLTNSGVVTEVKEGDIYIINSEEVHSVYGSRDDSYRGYALQINYDYLLECYPNMKNIYFQQVIDKITKEKLIRYVNEIINYYNTGGEYNYLKIRSILLLIIYLLLINQKDNKLDLNNVKSEKYKERMKDIIDYIEDNYQEDISIESLAEYFHLSYGYLSRLFKENTQMTIKDYITKVRIKHSKEDLINTDYSILDIGLMNGFPNIQSFYKAFKKEYNITPKQYRINMS